MLKLLLQSSQFLTVQATFLGLNKIKDGVHNLGQSIFSAGVSIIFKIRVFNKAWFEGFEFFIVWPYAVFHKMQVVFYKKCAFYVFQISVKDKQCFFSSKILS